MNTQIAIPIPTDLFLELADFLRKSNHPGDPVSIIHSAIDYWMDNASWKPELLEKRMPGRGYQWKSLFLPEGTQVRMPYKGKYYYATVVGDELTYENKPITPAKFANTIAQSSRNAWRDLWIKRPSDPEWRLADDCRPRSSDSGDDLIVDLKDL